MIQSRHNARLPFRAAPRPAMRLLPDSVELAIDTRNNPRPEQRALPCPADRCRRSVFILFYVPDTSILSHDHDHLQVKVTSFFFPPFTHVELVLVDKTGLMHSLVVTEKTSVSVFKPRTFRGNNSGLFAWMNLELPPDVTLKAAVEICQSLVGLGPISTVAMWELGKEHSLVLRTTDTLCGNAVRHVIRNTFRSSSVANSTLLHCPQLVLLALQRMGLMFPDADPKKVTPCDVYYLAHAFNAPAGRVGTFCPPVIAAEHIITRQWDADAFMLSRGFMAPRFYSRKFFARPAASSAPPAPPAPPAPLAPAAPPTPAASPAAVASRAKKSKSTSRPTQATRPRARRGLRTCSKVLITICVLLVIAFIIVMRFKLISRP